MFRIRQGKPGDAPALTQLAYRSQASWGHHSETLAACAGELHFEETDFPCRYFALAEEEAQLMGFYSLRFVTDRETELNGPFVEPAAMQQGYGSALLRHAAIQARIFASHTILIPADPHAVSFFRAHGAQLCGEKAASAEGIYLTMLQLAVG